MTYMGRMNYINSQILSFQELLHQFQFAIRFDRFGIVYKRRKGQSS